MPFTAHDLITGKPQPVSVTPATPLYEALEMMVENDFSQLPVVNSTGIPCGLVTNDSILKALKTFGVGFDALKVNDVAERAREYYPEDDIFDLLEGLRDKPAILVINNHDELIGIVTSFDATDYFRRRAEDIMLVEDIETAVREHLEAAFTDEKSGLLDAAALQVAIETATTRKNLSFDRLSLGQYIRVLVHETVWSAYGIRFNIDRKAIETMLDRVREIRNELAHFRGEISRSQREQLRFAANWFERNPVQTSKPEPIVSTPVPISESDQQTSLDEETNVSESRYAALATYLRNVPSETQRIRLTFDAIEQIIGGNLPASARKHRSWWANDTVSHVQSQQWLEADWRVGAINMTEGAVTFVRAREREKLYIDFFSGLIVDIKAKFSIRNASPSGISWHDIGGFRTQEGTQIAILSFSFARSRRFRVELYIDSANADWNKEIFDRLESEHDAIEAQLGDVSWERLDNRRASRLAMYARASIDDDPDKLNELRAWAVTKMQALYEVLHPIMKSMGYTFRG